MNIKADLALTWFILSLILLFLALPSPGVNQKTSIQVKKEKVPIQMYDNYTIFDNDFGQYTGHSNGDPKLAKISLATGWKPGFFYMSLCSHEVKHVKLAAKGIDSGTHHSRETFDNYAGVLPPWNWEAECWQTLPTRYKYW